jgi:hypothetical protein
MSFLYRILLRLDLDTPKIVKIASNYALRHYTGHLPPTSSDNKNKGPARQEAKVI